MLRVAIYIHTTTVNILADFLQTILLYTFIVDVIYFKLLLLVINNNLLTKIKNSKRRKNRGRNHEEMGLEREEKKFASCTFQIMNIVF